MSIAFLSNDWNGQFPYLTPGGCTFYRCTLPMSVLRERAAVGVPVWDPLRGLGVKETIGTGIFGWKTVVLKLVMQREYVRFVELAQQLGQYIVVDIDDYYQGLTPANAAYHDSDPENNRRTNRDNYEDIIQRADMLTVSTPFLFDYYNKIHKNVKIVRNGVNLYMFQPEPRINRQPVLGWTGSTRYRNNDLEQLSQWLPDYLEDHDLKIHHAGHADGSPTFAELTGVNPRRVQTSPLRPITKYADGFVFDIGLVPLNDIPFNHAKSNIKGLEYVAAGIPFVASDTPEYRLLHEGGVGALARSPEEWATQITTLLDRQHRKRTARWQYQIVERDWTIEARAKEWQDVLTSPRH